jgi:hypothetical protein
MRLPDGKAHTRPCPVAFSAGGYFGTKAPVTFKTLDFNLGNCVIGRRAANATFDVARAERGHLTGAAAS